MLQIGIWIAIKQVSSLSDQVFLRSLTKAVAIQQEHVVLALVKAGLLFKIAPNMLEGVANLTPVFWDLIGTVNQFFNMADLHLFILQVLANIIVNIARMTQNEVFVSRPELLALGFLVSLFHISPCFYQFPGNMETKLYLKNERIMSEKRNNNY